MCRFRPGLEVPFMWYGYGEFRDRRFQSRERQGQVRAGGGGGGGEYEEEWVDRGTERKEWRGKGMADSACQR